MPNIIIIEDDLRLRRQMEMFIHEIDGEKTSVRSLNDAAEFEKLYLNPKLKNEIEPSEEILRNPIFKRLPKPELTKILQGQLSTGAALPGNRIQIKIDASTLQATEILPSADIGDLILGCSVTDILESNEFKLESTLAPFHKGRLLKAIEVAIGEGQSDPLLVWADSEQAYWLVQVNIGFKGGNEIVLDLEDITQKVKPSIDREKLIREKIIKELAALQLFQTIDLVIVKVTSVKGKIQDWITQTRKRMKEFKYWPEGGSTRFIITKYEADHGLGEDLTHPAIDDLIFLPLDRQLFLQKMDILLHLPKIVQPRFLFSQAADIQVELSKLTKFEAISDVGLAIRNPVPLKTGLLAHFYFQVPGQKETLNLFGKVIRSEPHPSQSGQHIIYFSWFGAQRALISPIRQFLGKVPRYTSFKDDDPKNFRFNQDDPALTKSDRRSKTVVVIDSDEDASLSVAGTLRKDIDHLNVVSGTHYGYMVKTRIESGAVSRFKGAHILKATTVEIGPDKLSFKIHPDTYDLKKIEPEPEADTVLFGFNSVTLTQSPQAWRSVYDPETHPMFLEEGVRLAKGGRKVEQHWVAEFGDSRPREMRVSIQQDSEGWIVLEFIGQETGPQQVTTEEPIRSLELLVIDLDSITGEVDNWIDAYTETLRSHNLLGRDEIPKIIMTYDANRKVDPYRFSRPEIIGLLPKPIDNRAMLFIVTEVLQSPFSLYRFDNLVWSSTLIPVHVAKPVRVTAISEYGATFRHPKPIQAGSFLYIRQGIFDNAPGGALCARFYHTAEDESSEEGGYLCSALYFGINDAFLKFARSWIRETYAQSKSSETA